MSASCGETLHRLVRRLSAEYDINSPHEAPHMGYPSLPQHLGPEICTLPCLSILSSPNHERLHSDASTKLDSSQHEAFMELMDRVVKYKQHSIPHASNTLLRSLVMTFGNLLEFQVQRMIYNVMESKNKSRSTPNSEQDEEILKKFTELPTSSSVNGSLVVPESAWTNFSTMLPMEHWQEKDICYDNVRLRLMFHAEISVRITPNDTIHTAFVKAPGHVTGSFSNLMDRPELLDIHIDTTSLYNSIRRECKIISKKVVNAIVGFELIKPRHKRSSTRRTVAPSIKMPVANKPFASVSDGGTFKTEMTAMSSLDGREYRSASLGQDDFNKVQTAMMENNIGPKKKNRIFKFDHGSYDSQHGVQVPVPVPVTGDNRSISSMNSSAGRVSVLNDEDQANRFSIIYEESMEEVNSKKSKKKDRGWKRLVTPSCKKPDVSREPQSSTHDTSNNNRSDVDSVEKKLRKNSDSRWKRLLSTSKQ